MTETESRPRNRALVASFLFTDLVGYSKGTASEQYAAKAALSEILVRNLAALGKDDYRVKDTGDGCLIAFLVNPEHALYIALAIAHDFARAANAAGFPSNNVRTGLHIGAVKEAIDLEARPNFVGDGINAAKRIMDFAAPGQITASRAYFEAVSWLDGAYAALFQHLGASDDKHGRPHELYAIAPSDAVLEKLRSELASAAEDARETEKAAHRPPDEAVDRTASGASPRASPRPPAPRRWLAAVGVLAGVAVVAAIGFVIAPLNRSSMGSNSTDGKPGAAAPATVSSAQNGGGATGKTADAKEPTTPTQGAPDARVSVPPAQPASNTKSSTPTASAPEPTPPAAAKPDQAPATRSASDANAPPSPTVRATSSARPSAMSAGAETQRRTVEPAAASVAASTSPPAGAPVSAGPSSPASARCRHILEKVQVGEPLSQDEKRELESSCR